MKNILISFGIILCFLQFSCNKDFLNKTDPTRIGANKFFQTKTELEQAVNGIYGQLHGVINNQWILNELPTDNTTIDFNPDDRGQADRIEAFEFYTLNSSNIYINNMYVTCYNALFNINNTLAKLQNIATTAVSDSLKAQFGGQVKFLRAYYYFELTQYFGDVILITEPLDAPSKAWTYSRQPQQKVYAQIESDLKDAAAALPVKYDAANTGRVT
ncbi:MAG TPA: RagB/SusD family nutrient uptake outer membrane protein, partial [Chitinophagaceae bacterium]